jgi:hypothetical protein
LGYGWATDARSDVTWLADNMTKQNLKIMTLFNKVFSTRTLLQIICVLSAVVAMKALSAHYDFSWSTALAGE